MKTSNSSFTSNFKMMIRFFKYCGLMGGLIVFTVTLMGYYLFQANIPPYYSNSFSLNAKLLQVQKQSFKKLDVLAIGSSATLNHLNSVVIVNRFGNSYYNFSSWAQDMTMTRYFGEFYVKKYDPKLVIIISHYYCFTDDRGIEYSSFSPIVFALHLDVLSWGYAGSINIRSARKEFKSNQHCFLDREVYESLVFDAYGGVPLNIPKDKISMKRWDDPLNADTSESQYTELERLSKFLCGRNIKLVVVQTPIRKSDINERIKSQMTQHNIRCNNILNAHQNVFVDFSLEESLSDEAFYVDRVHLNELGATLFTQMLIDHIDSLDILK